ncbi:OmpA family protein [Nocardiopsis sp. NRRL B-16309]|uniref:OmpA family protein n=1 Tax=Nocardiopsis sp. NRRL B-16309 TaxID=1519494 RepID=UPI0006AF6961|nr:OmpA family protein [Nocardiopsis sp. NRRL B-16309]KOX13365.1 hypothetical protein ADL05_19150 [Nocardiopsis sp. NRRL B-16309]
MSRLRKPSAIALATVVLLGIPYLLVWHLSWPQLDLSWSGALVHLRGLRLPPGLGAALLIVALWALWGLYLAGLVVEGAARVRGTPGLLRPLGPLQVVAATAVGASVVAPTYALADTVTGEHETGGQEAPGAGDGDGGPASAPDAEEGPRGVERERVVAGFATGSAELTEVMRADLAPVVDLLRDHGDPDAPVLVTGHTDPTGDARTNQELSERRAQAVADHLAAELGDRAPETTVEGAGSSEQREGDHADQRRAELVYTVRTGPPEPVPQEAEEPGAEEPGEEVGADGAEERGEEVALTSVSQPDTQDEETEGEPEEDRVVVLEVPDHAVTASAAFAGVVGGYVLAKGGVRLPRAVLSLPRPRLPFTPGSARLALPPVPPRPTPGDEIDDRVSVELGHVPGIGLTGAGMMGAARRLLVNALDAPGAGAARVVITEADTGWLIGERGRELLGQHPCEPVRMVAGMPEALAVLQHELHQASDEALTTDAPAPLVLVARPAPEHELALSALLLHGQHRGISAVLLGRWPLGGSCVVEEDGLITETSTPLTPIFHHSWPGSDSDEVLRAIRAHRHSRPVADARFPREDEATEAAAEPAPQPARRRTPAEAVALSGFWDSLVENDDAEPNAFWEGVPELGTIEKTGVGADPASESDDTERNAAWEGVPEFGAPGRLAADPGTDARTESRHAHDEESQTSPAVTGAGEDPVLAEASEKGTPAPESGSADGAGENAPVSGAESAPAPEVAEGPVLVGTKEQEASAPGAADGARGDAPASEAAERPSFGDVSEAEVPEPGAEAGTEPEAAERPASGGALDEEAPAHVPAPASGAVGGPRGDAPERGSGAVPDPEPVSEAVSEAADGPASGTASAEEVPAHTPGAEPGAMVGTGWDAFAPAPEPRSEDHEVAGAAEEKAPVPDTTASAPPTQARRPAPAPADGTGERLPAQDPASSGPTPAVGATPEPSRAAGPARGPRTGRTRPDRRAGDFRRAEPARPADAPPDTEPSPWREPAVESATQGGPASTTGQGGTGRTTGQKETTARERGTGASATRSQAQARSQAPAQAAPEESQEDAGTPSRPLPGKPRKAGRGRTWRPKEKT